VTLGLHERLVKQFRLRPDQADQVLATHSVETINRQSMIFRLKPFMEKSRTWAAIRLKYSVWKGKRKTMKSDHLPKNTTIPLLLPISDEVGRTEIFWQTANCEHFMEN